MSITAPSFLDEKELAELGLSAAEAVEALRAVIAAGDRDAAFGAPKSVIELADGRYIMSTLAVMTDPPLVATKSLVLNTRNAQAGLAPINALVTLLDGESGLPLATIDGNWITGIRTAGLSALAAQYLANPDAACIGFIGTGLQARWHLTLFQEMFPLKTAKLLGRGRSNIEALCALCAGYGIEVEICESAEAVMAGADLLISSLPHTDIRAPFLDAGALAPGCFLSSVDLGVPWQSESFRALDQLFIDDLVQEQGQTSKLAPPDCVTGDLPGLVTGRCCGKRCNAAPTGFVFRGHALGDLAFAALAYQRWRAEGMNKG